jgi:enoyl-CoA hydratase/carnithine racemase
MDNVTVDNHGNVALLRLTSGVTNAIGPSMIADLSSALRRIRAEYSGCVLAGGTKFFSIGLNLPELIGFDHERMSRFWDAFDQAVLDLYTLPIPAAAAISGHAVAGGTILAMSVDYRLIAPGRNFMGLNEINIGLPVPYLADLMLRQVVGDRVATDICYKGEMVPPEEAMAAGLVDEITTEEKIEERSLELISHLAEKPRAAFSLIKQNRTEAVRARFEGNRTQHKEEMLSCWFEPSVHKLLETAAEKF